MIAVLHRLAHLAAVAALAVAAGAGTSPGIAATTGATAPAPNVAAASDLQFALTEIAAAFTRDTGQQVKLAFGSSGNFRRQIAEGAPFELFLSADEGYVIALATEAAPSTAACSTRSGASCCSRRRARRSMPTRPGRPRGGGRATAACGKLRASPIPSMRPTAARRARRWQAPALWDGAAAARWCSARTCRRPRSSPPAARRRAGLVALFAGPRAGNARARDVRADPAGVGARAAAPAHGADATGAGRGRARSTRYLQGPPARADPRALRLHPAAAVEPAWTGRRSALSL